MKYIEGSFAYKLITTFASRAFSAGGTFLLTFSLGHILGISGTGIFMVGLSIMMGLKVVGCFGMENAILRFGGQEWGNKNIENVKMHINTSFVIGLLISLPISFIFFIVSSEISSVFSSSDFIAQEFKLVAIAYPLFVLVSIFCAWMRACDLPALSSFFEIGSISMFTAIAMWSMCFIGIILTPYIATLTLLVVVVVEVVIGYIILCILKVPPKISFFFAKNKEFIKTLPDYFLIDFIFYLTQWGGVVLLGVFVESSSVGVFTIAHRLAFTVNFVLTVFDSIVAPKFSYLFGINNVGELKKLALDTTKYMIFMALPVVAVMIFFPSYMLSFFGKNTGNGAVVLTVLALAQFVNVSTGPVVFLLSMTGNQKVLKKILIYSSIIGTFGYTIMVPLFKENGAAIAIFITMAIQNLTSTFFVNKRLGFNTLLWWKNT